MRPRLLNPIREHARERPARRGHTRTAKRATPALQPPEPAQEIEIRMGVDPEAERVRRAGGPEDEATYSCGCGFLFSAAVSTTVTCPHCGGGQAW